MAVSGMWRTMWYAEPPRSNYPEHAPLAVKPPGPSPEAGSQRCWRGWQSTGCRRPASKLLPIGWV
jgi:hypothetical protein